MFLNKHRKKTKAELLEEIQKLESRLDHYERKPQGIPASTSSSMTETDIKGLVHMGAWFLELPSGSFYCSPQISYIASGNKSRVCDSFDDYLQSVHPDDRETFSQLMDQLIEDKQTFTKSVRHLHSSGNIIQTLIQVHYQQVFNQGALLSGFVLDVTQFQKAALSIEQENSRYRRLFELSPTGIILEDKPLRTEWRYKR